MGKYHFKKLSFKNNRVILLIYIENQTNEVTARVFNKKIIFLTRFKAIAVLLPSYYLIVLIRASSGSTALHDDLPDSAEVNDRFNATLTRKLIRVKLRYLQLNLSFSCRHACR